MSTLHPVGVWSGLDDLRGSELRVLDVLREADEPSMKIAAVAAASGLSLAQVENAATNLAKHSLVRRESGDLLELDHKGLQQFLEAIG